MDEILHHVETMINPCWLVFTGESSFKGFLGGAGFCPSTVWGQHSQLGFGLSPLTPLLTRPVGFSSSSTPPGKGCLDPGVEHENGRPPNPKFAGQNAPTLFRKGQGWAIFPGASVARSSGCMSRMAFTKDALLGPPVERFE